MDCKEKRRERMRAWFLSEAKKSTRERRGTISSLGEIVPFFPATIARKDQAHFL